MSDAPLHIVDLTHPLSRGIPVWPGDTEVDIKSIAAIDHDGYYLQELQLCEHSGTHFGASAHFHSDGTFADDLPPESFIRPAVCIDIRSHVEADHDYRLDCAAIEIWEREHGAIPPQTVLLLNTGWSSRWGDPCVYMAIDRENPAVKHYPGFSLEAARYLGEHRGCLGLGIDSPGIDAGSDITYSVNSYWLQGERFHLENLTSLEQLPPVGITLFIGVLKIARSSGGPARVLGVVY